MTRTTPSRSAPARAPDPLPRPGQLGPWHLVRLVAEGGLARVYQARPRAASASLPSSYAIKVLRPQWEQNAQAIECLRREAFVGSALSHAHLVPVLSANTLEPPFYVVMPWLTGSTLAARLAAGWRPPLATSLWIVRQVAEALMPLYQAERIHGDIKPSNIFLSPQLHVTLIDLGFARRLDEEGSLGDRCVLGTIHYLAPETVTSCGRADIRSDLYSLGITLYELLTGSLPFPGDDLGNIVLCHRQQRPPKLRRRVPGVPREVARLIEQMLAKEPLRRPQSPQELLARLVQLEIDALATWSRD